MPLYRLNKISCISLLFCIILTACVSNPASDESSKRKNKNRVKGGTINLALSDYPVSIYPPSAIDVNSSDIVINAYGRLLEFSPKDLSLIPGIAQKWEVNSTGTEYTFYLHKNVLFHPCSEELEGNKLTAHDVAFTIKNLCRSHPENLSFESTFKDILIGAKAFYTQSKTDKNILDKDLEGIQIIDDYTIKLKLSYPNNNFLNILATTSTSILSKNCFNLSNINSSIGSGAFVIDKNSYRKSRIVLNKNVAYYQKDSLGNPLPYLDKIIFTVYNKKGIELEEYKKGNLDLIWGIPKKYRDPFFDENKLEFKNDSIHRLINQAELSSDFVIFNTEHPIFKNPKIRQAFNYAIDKQKIITDVLKENAFTSGDHGIIPPSLNGYNATQISGYSFDLEKAKTLLTEAGYPGGKNFPEFLIEFNNDGEYSIALAIEIQKQLQRKLGIKKINIEAQSLGSILKSKRRGNSGMYISSWIADYPSPSSFLQLFYNNDPSKNSNEMYPNTSRYYNAEFNMLYEKANTTQKQKDQFKIFLSAEQILVNDAPFIPLFYNEKFILMRSNIEGFNTNPLRLKNFLTVYLVK